MLESKGSSKPLDTPSGHFSDTDDQINTSDEEKGKDTNRPDQERQQNTKPYNAGFLVEWDGDNDPLNPRSLLVLRKWLIVLVISMGTGCV